MIFGKRKEKEGCGYDVERRMEELVFDKELLKENSRMLKAAQCNCQMIHIMKETIDILRDYIQRIDDFEYEDRDVIFNRVRHLLDNLDGHTDFLEDVASITYIIDKDDEYFGSGRKKDSPGCRFGDDICGTKRCCDYSGTIDLNIGDRKEVYHE